VHRALLRHRYNYVHMDTAHAGEAARIAEGVALEEA
jgi:hypothetical protein